MKCQVAFVITISLSMVSESAYSTRSALYPEDWAPGDTYEGGRFLHDFSYAGYLNGVSVPPDNSMSPVIDAVADYEADNTGVTDTTVAIQQAIDAAASSGGGIVGCWDRSCCLSGWPLCRGKCSKTSGTAGG